MHRSYGNTLSASSVLLSQLLLLSVTQPLYPMTNPPLAHFQPPSLWSGLRASLVAVPEPLSNSQNTDAVSSTVLVAVTVGEITSVPWLWRCRQQQIKLYPKSITFLKSQVPISQLCFKLSEPFQPCVAAIPPTLQAGYCCQTTFNVCHLCFASQTWN